MFWKKLKSTWWPEILFLTIISALVYLPQVNKLSFHSDDWYFVFNGLVLGPKSFIDLTLHTRPIRGPLYEFLFSLYGINPLPYNLTLYFWRWLGGVGALWLFTLLWPKQRQANFFLTTLFLLFPGFLWWVSGFEFQPYVLSLTLQVFSIVFTLKAVTADALWKRVAWALGAIISGWGYLAMVEFSIGMEAFRILSVFLLLKHNNLQAGLKNLSIQTARASAVFLVIPVSFVFWYQFLFDNWRKAQQADVQLGRVVNDPLTAVSWAVRLFQSFVNVTLAAWIIPFNSNFYFGDSHDFLIRFALTGLVIAIAVLAFFFLAKNQPAESTINDAALPDKWQFELIWVGLLGTLAGVLPVVLANRSATFNFSQYGLPASLTGVLFLGGLVYSISPKTLRMAVLLMLIGLASLMHQSIAYKAVTEEKTIYDFWWQMSWRAPSIRAGTTLMAQYPFEIGDNGSLVWGPAAFTYYPEKQHDSIAYAPITAITVQPETLKNMMVGEKGEKINLVVTNIKYDYDYRNMLVMSQPKDDVCVRVINATWSEFSVNDSALTLLSSPYSKVENITPGAKFRTPPQPPFGAEPPHGWCYYYQKAELARQQEDWREVARLGDEAIKTSLEPNDAIEWMPFLQAYAYLGDVKRLEMLAKAIRKEPYYQKQACENLQKMNMGKDVLKPAILLSVNRLLCDN